MTCCLTAYGLTVMSPDGVLPDAVPEGAARVVPSRLDVRTAMSPAARAAQLARELDEHRTIRRRRHLVQGAGLAGAVAVGLGLMGWGLHLDDPGWGGIAFWAGLAVGDAGVLATLLVSYLSASERGEL